MFIVTAAGRLSDQPLSGLWSDLAHARCFAAGGGEILVLVCVLADFYGVFDCYSGNAMSGGCLAYQDRGL